jgi:hypothetical protein
MVPPNHLTDTPPGAVELDHAASGEHTANTSIAEVGDVVATANVASGEPQNSIFPRAAHCAISSGGPGAAHDGEFISGRNDSRIELPEERIRWA